MMRNRFLQHSTMLILLAAVFLAGCSSSPPPVQFYTLNSLSEEMPQANTPDPDQNIAIGIGPVQIPQILDRPQIVTRTGPNKIKVDEFHRWAGPLRDGFTRILAENISLLLATDRVAVYPWDVDFNPQYRVAVNIRYFEGQLGENVLLDVVWRVSDLNSQEVRVVKTSVIKEPLSAGGYDALVAAKSQAIARLSREIAREIQNLQPGG